ncbi:MAG TPA: hypothetical protein VNJ07_00315, partial [Chitinophagales bacterium]|nr:hypothetical protein [Chitinophagales bacterium]
MLKQFQISLRQKYNEPGRWYEVNKCILYSPVSCSVYFFLIFLCGFGISGFSQNAMQVRRYNFTAFQPEEKIITQALLENTPDEFRQHPEFGILPYKAGCSNCVELLQKRTYHSRYFIEPENSSHFYKQQSYFPLHYRDKSGRLRTIDPRLKPDANEPGVFTAASQPIPTKYDLSQHTAFIITPGLEFGFNRNLSFYYLDKSGGKQNFSPVDFSRTTVGESGALTIEGWKNIDVRQVFEKGGVKTDFIISNPLEIPANSEWVVFEDEIALPEGFEIVKKKSGSLAVEKNGRVHIDFHKPKYYDGYGLGISGSYDVERTAGGCKVKVLVPVSYLSHPALQYPVYIDPWVSGRDSMGNFLTATIFSGANLAFTKSTLGSCDYTLIDTVPGKSELFNAYIDLEYKVSDSLCVPSPPNPSPFCYFFDLTMEVIGPCGTSGQLMCRPANPPFLGICTTDPDKVPGAGAIPDSVLQNRLVRCIPPQCPDYELPFTLKNRSLQCPEVCGYNCAIGSFFAVTVEGRTIELDVEADKYVVCAEEPVRLTSKPKYGVPPYRYFWTPSGQTDTISTVYPAQTTTYVDTAFDICDNWAVDSLTITVKPTPAADAGADINLCDGDPPVMIGGNPTGPPGSAYQWAANPSAANGFISGATASNPFVAIPSGTTGSFEFIVRVEDAQCFRYDTMVVNAAPLPQPVIAAGTFLQICEGDAVTLSVTQPFAGYLWSPGNETTASIDVSQSGIYSVTVTDANGCTGSAASPVQVAVIPPPAFSIFPQDASIEPGESVTLGTDMDLAGSNVSSYF